MAFIEPIGWWGPMSLWLQQKANAHFNAWLLTREGKLYRLAQYAKVKNQTPYKWGYRQPEWMDDLRNALGRNDEETCKRLKLDNL